MEFAADRTTHGSTILQNGSNIWHAKKILIERKSYLCWKSRREHTLTASFDSQASKREDLFKNIGCGHNGLCAQIIDFCGSPARLSRILDSSAKSVFFFFWCVLKNRICGSKKWHSPFFFAALSPHLNLWCPFTSTYSNFIFSSIASFIAKQLYIFKKKKEKLFMIPWNSTRTSSIIVLESTSWYFQCPPAASKGCQSYRRQRH